MKALLPLLLTIILFIGFVQSSNAQSLKAEDHKFLKSYFSQTPKQRVQTFQSQAKGDVKNFFVMSNDLSSLSGVDTYKNGTIAIGGVIGAMYITNDTGFNRSIDSIRISIESKAYLKLDNKQSLLNSDTTDSKVLVAYLKNSPIERIAFIEENFDVIPSSLLSLMQLDLDKIFNTKSKKIGANKKCFLKAKTKWLASVKKA